MKLSDLPVNKHGIRYCPKCKCVSGDAWGDCDGACPFECSPHYDRATDEFWTQPREDYHGQRTDPDADQHADGQDPPDSRNL